MCSKRLVLLQSVRLGLCGGGQLSVSPARLVPDDEAAGEHEREHQCGPAALERIADHVVRVDSQEHQNQERYIRGIFNFICESGQKGD